MTRNIIRTRDDSVVSTRHIPIDHLLITATTSGGAQTAFTVPNRAFLLRRLSVASLGTGASLTLRTVPDGGTSSSSHSEVSAMVISPNSAVDLTDLVKGFYEGGTTFEVFASVGSQLIIHGWGEDLQ